MTPKLTKELRHALARKRGKPLEVEDPLSHARYVLVRLDVYEQMQRGMEYDASDPNPRDFYPLFAKAVKDDSEAVGKKGSSRRMR
jgi:hypothetical protein